MAARVRHGPRYRTVSLVSITLPALTFALSLDRLFNSFTRPFFGWVFNKFSRDNTMFIAVSLEALGIWLLSMFGESPLAFVIRSDLAGLVLKPMRTAHHARERMRRALASG